MHLHKSSTLSVEGTEGIWNRSFLGLAVLQFCTSFNDNAYRWLIIPIGYELLGKAYEGLILSVGLACFVVPYTLLPAPAGYLADRFSKRSVLAGSMIAQAVILCVGIWAILLSNVVMAFATLTLMGAQGALLAPAKSGCIPEVVRPQSISAANGVIGLSTILSAVAGSVLGEEMYVLTKPAGVRHWGISAAIMLGAALIGLACGLAVTRRPAADPQRRLPWNLARHAYHDLKMLAADRRLFMVALGSAFFWFLAAMCQINVYLFSTSDLHIHQEYIGPLLGILALGAGTGAMLAGLWSAGKIDLGIVPLSAVGMGVSASLLYIVPLLGLGETAAYFWTSAGLLLLGLTAGLYDVPLQSFLQYYSPLRTRGSLLAAANFLQFAAMLVSAGIFWILRNVLGASAGVIFLFGGICSFVVAAALLARLRREAANALKRPFSRNQCRSTDFRPGH